MKQMIYQVDAFASKLFEGNPAMVCPLEYWLPAEVMLNIAAENNLSETAFFVKEDNHYHLRWFTPKNEVDMCGHATLASAYVLFELLGYEKQEILFHTKSGVLKVWREAERYVMDFPMQSLWSYHDTKKIEKIFGVRPKAVFASMDYIIVFDNEKDVLEAEPDLELMKALDLRGVCITASSHDYDFVTRFFAPKYGIDEDPVTGSAFTQLITYWSKVLGKKRFAVKQVSSRGGELVCQIKEDRVEISGSAVKYLEGVIEIDM